MLGWMEEAYRYQDSEQLYTIMRLLWDYGSYDSTYVPILCQIGVQDWHDLHEDVASMLQELADSRSVEALFVMANSKHHYLEYDEAYALAVKCCWALAAIGNKSAYEKLKVLARDRRSSVGRAAEELLKSQTG